MTKKSICPACGSDDVKSSTHFTEIALPISNSVRVEEVVNVCGACGMEGDFLHENSSRIEEAVRAATKESVRQMIDNLGNQGVTMAYFERAFGLPQRTLARWKNGECAASAVALLRLVTVYPWLLAVADDGFDYSSAQQRLVEAASQVLVALSSRREVITPVAAGQPISRVSRPRALQTPEVSAPGGKWYSTIPLQR